MIRIASKEVGNHVPPFVIAEMSGNHNQSLDRALEIVDAAGRAGAHAVKIQTYTADTMTIAAEGKGFVIEDRNSLWAGKSLHKLYQEAHTPWEWHEAIFDRCRKQGLICFSTPFDESAVAFLDKLGVPCYKVASFENTDLPLIRTIAATGKPMIISTGMASVAELDEAVNTARAAGCKELVLLKCTSTYPATPENTNISTIPHMRELFRCEVGLSDHTMGTGVAVAAVALGATVVEKHFTLSRADGGVDSSFSLEPAEFAALVTETTRAWQSLGRVSYGPTDAERESLKFRRSLYVTADIKRGDVFDASNVRAIRPGYGLPPKHLDAFLGRRAARDIKRGTPLTWEMLAGYGNK